MTGWPTYKGRALDCARCAEDRGANVSAACSCIVHCGAVFCTGERGRKPLPEGPGS